MDLPWLLSSYSSGNQWYFDGVPVSGETNDSLNWLDQGVNGQYTLLYTDDNGCSKFSEVTNIITIDDIGFGEQDAFTVNVYPNPSSNLVNIQVDTDVDFIQLVSMNGQTLYNDSSVHKGTNKIDLSEFETGVYILQIVRGDLIVSKRIIKQ